MNQVVTPDMAAPSPPKLEPDQENYPAIQAMLLHALEWKREQEREA